MVHNTVNRDIGVFTIDFWTLQKIFVGHSQIAHCTLISQELSR